MKMNDYQAMARRTSSTHGPEEASYDKLRRRYPGGFDAERSRNREELRHEATVCRTAQTETGGAAEAV